VILGFAIGLTAGIALCYLLAWLVFRAVSNADRD